MVYIFSPPPSSPLPGVLFLLGPVSRTDIYRKLAALRSLGKHTKAPASQAVLMVPINFQFIKIMKVLLLLFYYYFVL